MDIPLYELQGRMFTYGELRARARKLFTQARAKGLVVPKACVICGDPQVEGHHRDYRKPYEVLWLCRQHHSQEHGGKTRSYQFLGPDSHDPGHRYASQQLILTLQHGMAHFDGLGIA